MSILVRFVATLALIISCSTLEVVRAQDSPPAESGDVTDIVGPSNHSAKSEQPKNTKKGVIKRVSDAAGKSSDPVKEVLNAPPIKPGSVDLNTANVFAEIIRQSSGQKASLIHAAQGSPHGQRFLNIVGEFPFAQTNEPRVEFLLKIWDDYCSNPQSFRRKFKETYIDLETGDFDLPANASGTGAGYGIFTTRIMYKKRNIPVMYYDTLGGSRLTFIPSVEVARNQDGSPMCYAIDPDTLDELELDQPLPLDKKVEFSIDLNFYVSEDLQRHVWSARDQLLSKIEGDENEQLRNRLANIPVHQVSFPHFTSIKIACEHEKHSDVVFELGNNPNLDGSERVFAIVPWSFVKRFCTRAGLDFEITYRFPIYRKVISQVSSEDVVRSIDQTIIDQVGDSFLSKSDDSDESKVRLLVDRNRFVDSFSRQLFGSTLMIEGQSEKIVNLLRQELRAIVSSSPSILDSKVLGEYYRATVDWAKALERPNFVTALQKIRAEQELTDSQRNEVVTTMETAAKSIAGGGKFAFQKGPIAFGLSSSGGKNWASEDFDFENVSQQDLRDFQEFCASLVSGTFSLPPDLDLALVSAQDLKTVIPKRVMMVLRSPVQEVMTTDHFNSAKPLFSVQTPNAPERHSDENFDNPSNSEARHSKVESRGGVDRK